MDKLFVSILNMSLTGGVVIVAICFIRPLFRRAPKFISYALWAVAGFRLAFPFSVESVFSLMPINPQPIPADIAAQSARADSGIAAVNGTLSGILPSAAPAANVNYLQIWITAGAYIWIIGAAVMLVYGAVSFVKLKNKMRNAVCAQSNIYQADNIKSPFVLGVLRPRIYLPFGLTAQEREYILLHERTHIKRYDHLIKFAAYLILCLHWFNPLTWVAFYLCGEDMEMSCDERVMKEFGRDIRDDYSMSLVRIAMRGRVLGGSPLAFGEGGVKGRVKRVLSFNKPSRGFIIAAAAFAAVLGTGFTLNRADIATNAAIQEIYTTPEIREADIPLELCEVVPGSIQTFTYGGTFEYSLDGANGGSVEFTKEAADICAQEGKFDENGVLLIASDIFPRDGYIGDGGHIAVIKQEQGQDGVFTGMVYNVPEYLILEYTE